MENLSKQLVKKSIEAFLLGMEIYNKPTIQYRVEGFSFFICNAWELMLKAKLINDIKTIYFSDNPDRTFDLSKVVHEVYSDKKQPLRINLEKIIDLRNTSTHFITEDYETVYAPLFQACVINYTNEIARFHRIDITDHVAQNFLTLSASLEPLTNEQISIKYPPEIAKRLIFNKNDVEVTSEIESSAKFSIGVEYKFSITKQKKDADFLFSIDKNSKNKVNIIKELKNPSETHKYSFANLCKDIDKRLRKEKISFHYSTATGDKKIFNSYTLTQFINFYDMKSDKKYAFEHDLGYHHTTFTYSQRAAEFIVNEIRKDPIIIDKLAKANKKKMTPGT